MVMCLVATLVGVSRAICMCMRRHCGLGHHYIINTHEHAGYLDSRLDHLLLDHAGFDDAQGEHILDFTAKCIYSVPVLVMPISVPGVPFFIRVSCPEGYHGVNNIHPSVSCQRERYLLKGICKFLHDNLFSAHCIQGSIPDHSRDKRFC